MVLLHVAIGYALLHLSGADVELARQADLAIFDVAIPPLPPPPPPPVVEKRPAANLGRKAAVQGISAAGGQLGRQPRRRA